MASMQTSLEKNDVQILWRNAENVLRDRIPGSELNGWFDDVHIRNYDDDCVVLAVPTNSRREHILKNFRPVLAGIFSDILRREVDVDVQLKNDFTIGSQPKDFATGNQEKKARDVQDNDPAPVNGSVLRFEPINSQYVFDTFVIGSSNKMAHAAAEAVSREPAQSYNPLFVYGGVGLGKTHLMQSIGNEILKLHPTKRVAYLSAELFVNIFIDAIKRNERLSFQTTFRNIDVLLIDDIHFLAGKEGTQEEFFHTFNALHNRHKQIVISSDRPPKDIPTIEDRLRSRFEWGLIVDVAPPDFEMRMAILRQKSENLALNIPDDVLEYIAHKIRFSIRELEGALAKITAHTRFTNDSLDVETAGKLLGEIYSRPVKEISIEKIQRKVADYFNIKPSDIIGKSRSRSIARPRQIAMYLSRKLTRHSFPEIGTFFGNKDHTTVLFAFNKIEKGIEEDNKLREVINLISDSFSKF